MRSMEPAIANPDRARLRRAAKGDIGPLQQLENRSFSYDRLSRRAIAHAVGAGTQTVLILEHSRGPLLGAAFLHYRARSQCCRLYSIAICSSAAGQGLGSQLLAACERDARARGCKAMRLEVRTDNFVAMRLYERRGYQKTRLKPGYYEDGAAAFSYAKWI